MAICDTSLKMEQQRRLLRPKRQPQNTLEFAGLRVLCSPWVS